MPIRVHNLRYPPGGDVRAAAAARLGIPRDDIHGLDVIKTSVDGRGRRPVKVATVEVDVADAAAVLARFRGDTQVRESVPDAPPAYHSLPNHRIEHHKRRRPHNCSGSHDHGRLCGVVARQHQRA